MRNLRKIVGRMISFDEMSLLSASRWGDFANWVLIVSLVMGVVSTFVIVQMSNVKERHWDLMREKANIDLEQAKQDTAAANAHAASVAESTERLRQQNLELELAVAPRGLEQGNSSKILSQFSGTEVIIVTVPDFEARRFAGMVTLMLQMSNWVLISPSSLNSEIRDGVEVEYVSGIVRPVNNSSGDFVFNFNERGKHAAEILVAQLKKNRIEANARWVPHAMAQLVRPNVPLEALIVRIGLKPTTYFDKKALDDFISANPSGGVILNNR